MHQSTPRDGEKLDDLLRSVRAGNLQVLKAPYETYKAEFMMFGARFGASNDDLLDVYQDAFVALIENVQHRGISQLRSSLKTYLFSIAKFLLFKKLKLANQSGVLADNHGHQLSEEELPPDPIKLTVEQDKLRSALATIGPKCRQLITLFYYQQWTIKEIMDEMGYRNENTVKANKSRCMKTLWQKIQKIKL